MDRINTSNKAVDLFGVGKHGYQPGNKAAGVDATYLSAAALNHIQEELARAIEASGQALDPSRYDQLALAIEILAAGATPAGTIVMTARAAAPAGWLLCQGQAVSRTTYAALFAAIGATYGAGDGSTTFNLPDLVGRFPMGVGDGGAYPLGQEGGNSTANTSAAGDHSHGGSTAGHALTEAELPAHSHTISAVRSNSEGLGGFMEDANSSGTASQSTTDATGGGQAHSHGVSASGTHQHTVSTVPPYTVVNFIIKA